VRRVESDLDATEPWPTTFVVDGARHELPDPLAVEQPLEVLVAGAEGPARQLAVVLRTPGDDAELVAGLLYAEGIVDDPADLAALEPVEASAMPAIGGGRRLLARLRAAALAGESAPRPFLSTSACGLCGSSSLDAAFATGFPALPAGPRLAAALLQELPDRMKAAQRLFAATGGLHAAALFDAGGELLLLREDVGRHNAVDKLVGALLLAGRLPAGEVVLAVSGRVGFEVAQKALRAGIPVLVAVGAPSSLAGMTLGGFARPDRLNVYCGAGRVG
jgi:FdhD protein